MESTPSATHISFKDRKTAETFYAGLNGKSLPEQKETLAVAWVPNGSPGLLPPAKEGQNGRGMDVEPSRKDEPAGVKQEDGDVKQVKQEEGEVEMDYEVADEDEWID